MANVSNSRWNQLHFSGADNVRPTTQTFHCTCPILCSSALLATPAMHRMIRADCYTQRFKSKQSDVSEPLLTASLRPQAVAVQSTANSAWHSGGPSINAYDATVHQSMSAWHLSHRHNHACAQLDWTHTIVLAASFPASRPCLHLYLCWYFFTLMTTTAAPK